MKNLDGIKNKKIRRTKKKPARKTPVKPVKQEMSAQSKKAMMWILVGIFTAFFVVIAFFSIKAQLDKPNDNSFLDLFRNITNTSQDAKEEFRQAFDQIFGQDEEEQPAVDDQTIEEWEEKLFPELNTK